MDSQTRSLDGRKASARRYHFETFTVSTGRRLLLDRGREIPLIPRYFDLLVLLLAERYRAVKREEILDAVWRDVIVSDGALSQAVRTLRRALGDTAREPRFIRTVARHGYRFVYESVSEEIDGGNDGRVAAAAGTTAPGLSTATTLPVVPPLVAARPVAPRPVAGPTVAPAPVAPPAIAPPAIAPPPPADAVAAPDPFEPLLRSLLEDRPDESADADDERRLEAAEALHLLGTDEAMRRLDRLPGHERGRAWMREARWELGGAIPVPIIGRPGWPKAVRHLLALRLRGAARFVRARWGSAAAGGAAAGMVAGFLGGALLKSGSGGAAPPGLPVTLAILGLLFGGLGAAGVGAGLVFAEAVARSRRGLALVLCGALAGAITGTLVHLAVRGFLVGMFGQDLPHVGGLRGGLMLGAAAGFGYALSTPRPHGGGMATPRGGARLGAMLLTGLCCALAGVVICRLGWNLAGTSLNLLAHTWTGSHVGLGPIARMVGEADPGPWTRTLSGGIEGLFFGTGLAAGLTRRPSR